MLLNIVQGTGGSPQQRVMQAMLKNSGLKYYHRTHQKRDKKLLHNRIPTPVLFFLSSLSSVNIWT